LKLSIRLEEKVILNTKQMLQADQISQLRQQGVINEREYAYIAGDLLVAENVTTSERRVIGNAREVLTEGTRQVLRG
jgi:hypothetical protein